MSKNDENKSCHEVLIVDDDEDLRFILEAYVSAAGFKVLLATTAEEALTILAERSSIEIIISDFRMPGMSGLEFLRKVRDNNAEKPSFVFITGFNDISVEEALDGGAEALFFKPFDEESLTILLNKLIKPQPEIWKKRCQRVRFSNEVCIVAKGQVVEIQSVNLGRGGLFAAIPTKNFSIGERVKFQFSIQNEHDQMVTISGDATIRWLRREAEGNLREGIGIEFDSVTPPGKSILARLVNDLNTRSYIPKG